MTAIRCLMLAVWNCHPRFRTRAKGPHLLTTALKCKCFAVPRSWQGNKLSDIFTVEQNILSQLQGVRLHPTRRSQIYVRHCIKSQKCINTSLIDEICHVVVLPASALCVPPLATSSCRRSLRNVLNGWTPVSLRKHCSDCQMHCGGLHYGSQRTWRWRDGLVILKYVQD